MRDLQVNAICNLPDLQQLVTKSPTYLLYHVPNRQQHLPKPLQLRKIFGGNHVWTQQICRRRCEGPLPAPRRLRDRDAGHRRERPRSVRVSNSGAPEPRFSGKCAITQARRKSQSLKIIYRISSMGPSYRATWASAVTRVTPSAFACATSMRSNGSLWIRGSSPAISACPLSMHSS